MDLFEKHDNEYLKFEHVKNKRSNRPDLHAFLLIDELFPKNRDMVCSAAHDEIWLDIDDDEIKKLTEEQIIELIRCGVRHDDDSLVMFA